MQQLTQEKINLFLQTFPHAKRDELMSRHTLLKIGGPARLYLETSDTDELIRIVQTAKQHSIPLYVFGGGSNMLVSDDGFEGVMIQTTDRSWKIDGEQVIAAPGVFTGALAREAAKAGLTGFEWGIGVPGMIGGATYGNAGCFGGEMKDVVTSVEAFDLQQDARVSYSNADCRFGYRDSRFKHEPHLLLQTTLTLQRGDATQALKQLEEVMSKRKDTQPQGAFSAGCLFKNFEYEDPAEIKRLQAQFEVPEPMLMQKRIGAGWLVEQLGLKGTTVGNAQVSSVHGNFLVNLGGARAQDVIALASLIKMKIRDELGILLEDEVQLVGF